MQLGLGYETGASTRILLHFETIFWFISVNKIEKTNSIKS